MLPQEFTEGEIWSSLIADVWKLVLNINEKGQDLRLLIISNLFRLCHETFKLRERNNVKLCVAVVFKEVWKNVALHYVLLKSLKIDEFALV